MSKTEFKIEGEEQTVRFGALMSKLCVPYAVKNSKSILIFLEGDLGAGKTTFSRGFIEGCGYEDIVRSPTYTLVEPYDFSDYSIYHFDLYRLLDPEELEYMGIRDYFEKTSVSLVEWPDKAQGLLPEADVRIALSYSLNSRNVVIESSVLSQDELDGIASCFN
jgi:tRNA threonylcarbamoyladenosine biosynthesis protein TsaE